jgi:hypothetical protein
VNLRLPFAGVATVFPTPPLATPMRPWRIALLALVLAAFAVPQASAAPVTVEVELHVIHFGNYDASKGTYTLDFYLHLAYGNASAPEGFDATGFEFMNGRASSRELLSDETAADGRRDLWYRIQANLFSDPQFKDFPYDHQALEFTMEDSLHTTEELEYRWATVGDGLDDDLRVAGWQIDRTEAEVTEKRYPFKDGEETYSRLTYTIQVSRPAFSATMRTFLPPAAFLLVASFSFFLRPTEAVSRLTLGTGMLISAVAFHLSQMVNVPVMAALTPFDRFMIASYAFIASCIFVTVALSFGEKLRLPAAVIKLANRWGAVAAIALPLLLYGLLWLV